MTRALTRRVEPHHFYQLTVQGQTTTVEGPPDIVNMYRAIRLQFPPALCVELVSLDQDLRPLRLDGGRAPLKVHS